MGVPPNCRPECSINSDCPANRACIREKCKDPCPGSCGLLARCLVINHTPSCVCPEGYTGDPFISCNVLPQIPRKGLEFSLCYYRSNVTYYSKSLQFDLCIFQYLPQIDAIHHHVVRTLNATTEFAHVYQNTLETHMPVVDRNV